MNVNMPSHLSFRPSKATAKNEAQQQDTTKASEDACMDGARDAGRCCGGENGCLG
ncbi:hypothetical protein IV102_04160 [bacterium]|nr:hypothetical protein [bacterium]